MLGAGAITPFQSEVWVGYQGTKANGKSLLDMTSHAAECGSSLDLEALGPNAGEAVVALSTLVAAGFYINEEDCQ